MEYCGGGCVSYGVQEGLRLCQREPGHWERCFSLLGSSKCSKMQCKCSLRRWLWKILFQKSVFLATKCRRPSYALDRKVDPILKLATLWALLRILVRNRQSLWRLLLFQVTSVLLCHRAVHSLYSNSHAVLPKCSFSVMFHLLRRSITDQNLFKSIK